MTLSLTFDHRVIDGEQGSRLLRDLGGILADPATTLALA
jgi:pyruvate dehydrogenase E2 component (dihydrolipoamide acetyltransferase)